MSANGNGDDDDDIDKVVDALRETNESIQGLSDRLDRLFESIQRGVEEDTGQEIGGGEREDLWDVGSRVSGRVSSPDQYIELRRKSFFNDQLSAPKTDRSVRDKVGFYIKVYRMYGEHLQKIYYSLNNDEWSEFVRRLSILYGVEEELVSILQPDPAFFGVQTIDGEVSVIEASTHVNYTFAFDNYWFAPEVSVSNIQYDSVGSAMDYQSEYEREVSFGDLSSSDIDSNLAQAIDDRGDLSLPEKYRRLL